MKNKKATYLLLALVVIIWGIIIFRLTDSLSDNEQNADSFSRITKKEHFADSDTTYKLILNYRDPFLGKRNFLARTTSSTNKKISRSVEQKADVSYISFLGIIGTAKKKIAIVNYKGKEYMVKEGDMIEEARFVKYYSDSIKVNIGAHQYYIKKQR